MSFLKRFILSFAFLGFILVFMFGLVTTIVVLYISLLLYVCMFILLCNVVIC